MKTLYLSKKLNLIREFLFPLDCAVCGRTLLNEAEAWIGLCGECAESFPSGPQKCCSICGRPLISEMDVCMNCRKNDGNLYDSMTLLYPYIGREQRALKAYKFGKHRTLARFFSEKMLSAMNGSQSRKVLPLEVPWIPVPPRAGKLKTAGWDQVELIAKILEKLYHVPVLRCLKRLASKTQKELGKSERITNLKGRIVCPVTVPEEVIVFDDVFTTGSTMNACAGALKDAGAKKVHGICLFYS
ncbi:MAG: double zinc ribbon domain-containing protein [Spirochaetaceae bacterium]|jgi:ComF family protein|nr:double zinc ribbon domain-containing protein [Spirochaetaceae bacterium]